MRFNRFVFLNRPMLSLETHLGVTTSPQAPFPTDYVTWSVSDQSPPLRLTPSRSRRRSCSATQHQHRRTCIPGMLKQLHPQYRQALLARRTVGDVGHPQLIGQLGTEATLHEVGSRPCAAIALRGTHPAAPAHPTKLRLAHQPRHPVVAGRPALLAQLRMHPWRPVGASRALVRRKSARRCCPCRYPTTASPSARCGSAPPHWCTMTATATASSVAGQERRYREGVNRGGSS